jgi:hypothetical protein
VNILIADPARAACLRDGLHAAVCITPAGGEELWLLVVPNGDDEPAGCRCWGCAPHEQDGELPAIIRRRLNRCHERDDDWQCSRSAHAGEQFCWQHKRRAANG